MEVLFNPFNLKCFYKGTYVQKFHAGVTKLLIYYPVKIDKLQALYQETLKSANDMAVIKYKSYRNTLKNWLGITDHNTS